MKKSFVFTSTFKYVLALALLGVFSFIAYLTLSAIIAGQQNCASIVNNGGRQRMLLERTALYALRLSNDKEWEDRQVLRKNLTVSIQDLETSHNLLVHSILNSNYTYSTKVKDIYFKNPYQLDKKIHIYIEKIKGVLALPDSQLAEDSVDLQYIQKEASGQLLDNLDKVMSIYADEINKQISILKLVELTVLFIIVIILILEGMIIFRPMVSKINKETIALEEANKKLKALSILDSLTSLANRRFFDERIEFEWARSIRESRLLSIIMIDIDFFKNYNDTYGHQVGDDCLIKVSSVFRNFSKRPGDLVARYGGEEFIILLSDTDLSGAGIVADKIRIEVQNLKIPHKTSKINDWVTISLGVATILPKQNLTYDSLISKADTALYQAKKNGRNKVEMSDVI